ncbi:glycosyl hydrolase 2 galactose-binding domain-containing protein [Coraliomargarita sp. W4R53]
MSHTHQIIDLSESKWMLAKAPSKDLEPNWDDAILAKVPGCVLSDLVSAGLAPDPYYGENFRACKWAGEWTFWYRTSISVNTLNSSTEKDYHATLIFEAIDTYGEVFLNGISLGKVDNQFIRHSYEVTELLLPDQANELIVRIDAVKNGFNEWYALAPRDDTGVFSLFDMDRPWIRKSQMTFGWDNCPYLVAGGITLPARLELTCGPELHAIQWSVHDLDVDKHTCSLQLKGKCKLLHSTAKLNIAAKCGSHSFNGSTLVEKNGEWHLLIKIENAQFWWPNGMGLPNLYEITLTLNDEAGATLTDSSLRIGLRTVRVINSPTTRKRVDYRIGLPDEDTSEATMDGACIGPWQRQTIAQEVDVEVSPFQFEVNTKRVFIKGFDWQAPDVLVGNVTDEAIHTILDAVVDAHCNMLRAWGGGAIERDSFYRGCDERGLLLWQDFFFACAVYPRDPAFLERLQPEIEDIVRRLRNHTCLIAWCGDNESDMIEYDMDRDIGENPINKKMIPQALSKLDLQQRYYHVSSPSGGPYPRSDFGGDKRNWGPNFPHNNYFQIRQESGQFISESGMKSFPSMAVIEGSIPKERRWPLNNSTWRLHWGDLDEHIRGDYNLDEDCIRYFDTPNTLEERICVSQFAQAYGTRLLIEQCRRRMNHCGGILLWKTADQWPCCDQGIFDSGGFLRPYYHAVKDAFRSISVSIVQDWKSKSKDIEIWLCSDLEYQTNGTITIDCIDLSSNKKAHLLYEKEIATSALKSERIAKIELKGIDANQAIIRACYTRADTTDDEKNTTSWYALVPAAAYRYHRQIQENDKNVNL